MAALMRCLFTSGGINPFIPGTRVLPQLSACGFHTSSTLDKYPNWKMVKDVRIRKTIKEYAFERVNVNALRKARRIIPAEIKEIADAEIAALPTDSSITRMHGRCMVTSRPRGIVKRWRLSRIVFRHEADYNKLSGIQRAIW